MLPATAMILISAIATSSTGGNSAGPGIEVHTGDAYAESHVSVTASGQGTSTVDIETNINGERHVEHIVRPNAPGVEVHIDVATSSSAGSARVEVHVDDHAATSTAALPWFKRIFEWGRPAASTVASTTEHAAVSTTTPGSRIVASIFERISSFWSGFFGFFK